MVALGLPMKAGFSNCTSRNNNNGSHPQQQQSRSSVSKSKSVNRSKDRSRVRARTRSYYKEEAMRGILLKESPASSNSLSGFSSPALLAGSARVIFALVVLLSVSTCVVLGGYPPSSYYPVKKYPYLPAPPGETPTCAKHGSTFCEKIETYPTEVVSYLLYKYGNTYQQFLKSEADRDFFLISQTYGPPGYGGGYSSPHDKPYHHNHHYNNNNNNNNHYQQGGYSNNNNNYNNYSAPVSGGYSDSYYRPNDNQNSYNNNHNNHNNIRNQREYGGYGGGGGGGGYQFAAAAMPPMVQSMWWNHRDRATNQPAYPYLQQHRGGYSRKKRQVSGDGQLCATRSNFIAPQAAMNNEGNWMYVVNLDDPRYLQMVRAEFCANGDGSPCNGVCNVGPGVRASCRQKYVQKRLVALDGSGDRFLNDVFWFAHCCVCQVN